VYFLQIQLPGGLHIRFFPELVHEADGVLVGLHLRRVMESLCVIIMAGEPEASEALAGLMVEASEALVVSMEEALADSLVEDLHLAEVVVAVAAVAEEEVAVAAAEEEMVVGVEMGLDFIAIVSVIIKMAACLG
jgi:hypothetical protein